jgi:propanediol utilization protein
VKVEGSNMNIDESKIREIVLRLLDDDFKEIKSKNEIPIETSARHVHLSQGDIDKLFGTGYKLTPKRDLSQPGQYLCEERVKLVTEKYEISNVAILGPVRNKTQVEISLSDARNFGIYPPIRVSGDLDNAEDIFIVSGRKMIEAKQSAIIAQNHIHMAPEDAERFKVSDGQCVQVQVESGRPVIFSRVPVRVDKSFRLAMHVDFDEANACSLSKDSFGVIL